jgi:hypothetical protein
MDGVFPREFRADRVMTGMLRLCSAALASILLLAGAGDIIVSMPEKLAPWTAALSEQQPDGAFAVIYLVGGGKKLAIIGAKHSTDTESDTFYLIDQFYPLFHIDTAILEGWPNSWGPNADRVLNYPESHKAVGTFQSGAETVPAVQGARAQGAAIWGGEPDDGQILARLRAAGVTETAALGFYTLRTIPQWVREHKITGAGDPALAALLDGELAKNRARLGVAPDLLPDAEAWKRWYLATNHRHDLAEFDPEEAGPRTDGDFPTNRIAAEIGRARDGFLLEQIAKHLNAGEDLVVVYGGSHLMILRPALDAMLGAPCYFGADLAQAARACS